MTNKEKSKYQNRRSYNGQAVPEGMVLAPVWFSKVMKQHDDSCIDGNFTTWKFCGVHFLIGFVPIEEDRFDSYMSYFWSEINEHLSQIRPGRCIIDTKKDGTPKVCPKTNRCTGCDKYGTLPRYNPVKDDETLISLDYSYEDEGFDYEDKLHLTPEDEITLEDTFLDLVSYLKKIKPRYAEIVTLGMDGLSPEEIIKKIQLRTSRGYQEIENAYKHTLEYLHFNNR